VEEAEARAAKAAQEALQRLYRDALEELVGALPYVEAFTERVRAIWTQAAGQLPPWGSGGPSHSRQVPSGAL
jgi:hypothetical protein